MIEGDDVPSAEPDDGAADEKPTASSSEEGTGVGQSAPGNNVPQKPEVQSSARIHRTPEKRAEAHARHERHRRRRRRRKIAGWTMLTAGVLILAGTAWVGWRSYQAYSHLQTASAEVATLQDQLKDVTTVDPTAGAATVERLQAEAAAARSAVNDPIYGVATAIPLLGPNLAAIREVTVTVDSLATDVMPSLVEVARTLRPSELAPTGGVIDLPPIERISPLLQAADSAVNQARQKMAGVDRSAVVQPVGDAVLTLWGKLDQAAGVTDPAARIARLLPPMLGSETPRTYLVVFQNPTEVRATGGMFGSFALVRADQGRITIVDQGPTRNLGKFDPPAAELTRNERILYSDKMVRFPADVNFTPDFPTAARLYMEMYRLRTATVVDGVLAIDPVALSYALKGSAPIDIGDGVTISADTVVPILLSTAYQEFDKDQSGREAFLANATGKTFGEVMSGHGDAKVTFDGLRRAVDERRLLLYSADEAEQAEIATTSLAGILNADPAVPTIGVFLNDGTMAKLDYYLSNEVHVTAGECRPDGRRELQVRVVMHYNTPTDGLPTYVTGTKREPGQPYILKTNVLVFAPVRGGIVSGATRDGASIGIARGEDQSREVGTVRVEMSPGTTTELVLTVVGPAHPAGGPDGVVPQLTLTPGVTPWVTSVEPYPSCRAPSK